MRNAFLSNRFAAVAAVFLMLAATPACNDFDEPEDAEAVVTISATALSGISLLAAMEDVAVKLTLNLTARGGAAPSPFNDVIFTNFDVTFNVNPPSNGAGLISTAACPIGGTCELTLVLITAAEKTGSGFAAGDTFFASVHVEGADLNGNTISFDALVPITLTA